MSYELGCAVCSGFALLAAVFASSFAALDVKKGSSAFALLLG